MPGSGSLLAASVVSVAATAPGTVIAAANANRTAVIIRNVGTNAGSDVFIGESGVTTATGMPLERGTGTRRGETLVITGTAEVRGIVAAGTQDVAVLEIAD